MAADVVTGLLARFPGLASPGNGWGDHWGEAAGWPWLWPLMWLAWIAVIAAVVWLALRTTRGGRSGSDRAKDLLAERYARGEITTDEYRERLGELR